MGIRQHVQMKDHMLTKRDHMLEGGEGNKEMGNSNNYKLKALNTAKN
jgi:hypothetical protein